MSDTQDKRPAVPMELRRRLLVEAGHRCAIPTCRTAGPLELAHIDPWAKVQEHQFENMIVLCSNCHGRFDRSKDIDRKSMLAYKANLALLNSRYGTFERRVLELFAKKPEANVIALPATHELLITYLLDDGLLVRGPKAGGTVHIMGMPAHPVNYTLTEKGREVVNTWVNSGLLD